MAVDDQGLARQTIDQQVGGKIRSLRADRGDSLSAAADALKMSLAEYMEIEAGVRRLTSAQICLAASHFDREIGWFFEGLSYNMPAPDLGGAIDLASERAKRRVSQGPRKGECGQSD